MIWKKWWIPPISGFRKETGIQQRRIAAEGQCSSHLAEEAGREALQDAGVDASELDLVICATLTPDTPMPCTACRVVDLLGANQAGAFDLSVACSGFAYATSVAHQFIANGNAKKVLVIGVETLSRILNWKDRGTCVLFGDGAAAAVVGATDPGSGILGFDFGADGSGGKLLKIPAGPGLPSKVPLDHTVHMTGRGIFKFAIKAMEQACSRALERAQIQPEQVDLFIPHQANLRIIEAAARRLNIEMERVYVNIQRYGNTSTASIPLALYDARKENRIKSGDTVVTVGFGGGLAWSALVMRWA